MAHGTRTDLAGKAAGRAGNEGSRAWWIAAGSILGALAASSCCILPLLLFSTGISGAWIANFMALAPYKPYFAAATLALLGYGHYLIYLKPRQTCVDGSCARPLPNRLIKSSLWIATLLVVAAPAFDYIAATGRVVTGERRTPMKRLVTLATLAAGLLGSGTVLAAEQTVRLAVSNMYCASCPHIVRKSLAAVPGVSKVAVSYKEKSAVVTFDDEKTNVEDLIDAGTKAGYPTKLVAQGS